MKQIFKNNKKLIIGIAVMVILIAGLLDIKYEGLFYQILPESLQSSLSKFFN